MNTPTGYSALDLVGFTDRGDYSSSETYVKNDLVHYLGDIWRVKLDDITGQTPSEGTYYTIFIEGIPDKAYKTDDTTENTLASDDVLPFYDTSASAKRKMPVQKFAEQLISNPNLLDNPWFTVNQRDFSSDTIKGGVYFADRWQNVTTDSAITISNTSDGVTINGTPTTAMENLFTHYIEKDKVLFKVGDLITLSVMLSDGTVYKATNNIKATTSVWVSHVALEVLNLKFSLMTYGTTESYYHFICRALSGAAINQTIRAIKLEKGSVSTLAMDSAPNYATELLKCQRYFVRFKSNKIIIFTAYAENTNARATVFLPTAMRTLPTVTQSGNCDWVLFDGDSSWVNTLVPSSINNQVITLGDDGIFPSITNFKIGMLRAPSNSSIDFSADL